MTELEAKIYISQVRTFYEDLLCYGVVNAVFILIWMFFSATWYFWPGWVILGWGGVLLRRSLLLKVFSFSKFGRCFPCFNSDWEEKQVKKLTAEPHTTVAKAKGKSE